MSKAFTCFIILLNIIFIFTSIARVTTSSNKISQHSNNYNSISSTFLESAFVENQEDMNPFEENLYLKEHLANQQNYIKDIYQRIDEINKKNKHIEENLITYYSHANKLEKDLNEFKSSFSNLEANKIIEEFNKIALEIESMKLKNLTNNDIMEINSNLSHKIEATIVDLEYRLDTKMKSDISSIKISDNELNKGSKDMLQRI